MKAHLPGTKLQNWKQKISYQKQQTKYQFTKRVNRGWSHANQCWKWKREGHHNHQYIYMPINELGQYLRKNSTCEIYMTMISVFSEYEYDFNNTTYVHLVPFQIVLDRHPFDESCCAYIQ